MRWTLAHALWDAHNLGPPPADLLDGFDPDAPPTRSQYNVVGAEERKDFSASDVEALARA
jgi:hypothetical protein